LRRRLIALVVAVAGGATACVGADDTSEPQEVVDSIEVTSGSTAGSTDPTTATSSPADMASTSAPAAELGAVDSVCVDDPGDVSPLGNFATDEVVENAADIVETRVGVDGEALVVVWTFAPGAAADLELGGNHSMMVGLVGVDGSLPSLEVSVGRTAGFDPLVSLYRIPEQSGPVTEDDPEGADFEIVDESARLSIPLSLVADFAGLDWQWFAESTMGRADPVSGEQMMGQDACGSTEAGAGSAFVYFPGVSITAVNGADPGATDGISEFTPVCERVPPVEEVEAIVEVELGPAGGRYDTECSFNGVVDPTDYVLFSSSGTSAGCPSDAEVGELGAVPYSASGGISGIVDMCLADETLRVTTSIGSIDDDDGPLAIDIGRLWLESLGEL
jgi:hypothetical protein